MNNNKFETGNRTLKTENDKQVADVDFEIENGEILAEDDEPKADEFRVNDELKTDEFKVNDEPKADEFNVNNELKTDDYEPKMADCYEDNYDLKFNKKDGKRFDPNYVINAMKLFNLKSMLFDKNNK